MQDEVGDPPPAKANHTHVRERMCRNETNLTRLHLRLGNDHKLDFSGVLESVEHFRVRGRQH